MAQYKLIQDIEAEDKLIGPLSLKGFIYALIAGLCAFIDFRLVLSGFGTIKWLFIFILLPPILLFGLLASPLGREQPTEIWLLSRIKYFLKPRKRIWDQEGPSQLVRITAPKKVEGPRVKDFKQDEIQGRLRTLASTLDSRGWAIKNVNLNVPSLVPAVVEETSDRLIDSGSVERKVPEIDVTAADDMLDEKSNPTAQHFQGLMDKADIERRKNMILKMDEARYNIDNIIEQEDAGAKNPSEKTAPQDKAAKTQASTPQSEAAKAAKLDLAKNANNLSVAAIAQLANHAATFQQISPTEGIVNLHG